MKIARLVHRNVAFGGKIPLGWRMAWYDSRRRVGVYGPVPLHWILRLAREFAYRLRAAITAPAIERAEILAMQRRQQERQRLADEYSDGYMTGWRECFDVCLTAVEQELDRPSHAWEIGELLRGCSTDREN